MSALPIGPETKILASTSPSCLRTLRSSGSSGIPRPHQSSTLYISVNKLTKADKTDAGKVGKSGPGGLSHRTSAAALPRTLMHATSREVHTMHSAAKARASIKSHKSLED
eukprot:CAMPEP_0185586632 /NCGR_PEP_ID=MMETSP0434-20130131/45235_1 /TAXON_ID=626734 ORGANISM="Favella taraikaensis, Strain Fe Narragansett Bay" /NCGR_SAMPLE_ID=MMETSP0434 /ASSEMBLY_ACC=CAM_ASM_000379 /LENGTH=109 /DNA_ID=CAMNT_0028207883 /DNA_START=716 /DNA_END=1045 /DNA_ORIENTATION=-